MKQTDKEAEKIDFDYVFAGASIIRVDGNLLTATGIYKAPNEDGKKVPCVKIRVNREARVQLFSGDIFELSGGKKVKVVKIEAPKTKTEKGKIYLKVG